MKTTTMASSVKRIIQGSALASACVATMPAQALEYQFDEFLLNVDVTLGYAAQWRTESRDKKYADSLNANDGNNSFDSGSMTSSKLNGILEVGGEYRDFNFFVRGDALYDYVYADGTSDMSRENYNTFNNGQDIYNPFGQPVGDVRRGSFADDTVDEHGKRLRLLDLWASYNLWVGDSGGTIRAGRQVISWGEATFYSGINALQNPVDLASALAPGVELKEVFLPTAAVDLTWEFTPNFSAEAYWKDWEGSTLPGVGFYLSTNDFTGPGAENVLAAPNLAVASAGYKQKPEDEDQYGITLRYLSDQGANVEVSYIRAHANAPGLRGSLDLTNPAEGLRITEVYSEDIDVWGLSSSTNFGDAQVYADLAYSDNMPFIDAGTRVDGTTLIQGDVISGHYWQAVVGMTDTYTALPWLSQQIILLAEAIYTGNNLGGSEIDYEGLWVTDTAWGFQGRMILKYFQPIRGMDVDVPITFRWDVDGYGNLIGLNNGLKEDSKTASIGVDGFYLNNWQFSASYAWYFGNDKLEDATLVDRDNLSISVKYRF